MRRGKPMLPGCLTESSALTHAGSDDKRRVVEATDLVRLIGEQVALRKKGREFTCLCPFHEDHNPSMYVVPHKQIYHCFVCGAGGDAISFAMNFFKMPFREALQFLADRASITLTPMPRRSWSGGGPEGDEAEAPGVSREALLAANQTALAFFRGILRHAEHGKVARALIERRGLSPEMVELFQLGASPDRWDGLSLTIANKGLDAAAFLSAGLLKGRESGGGAYDALRNRLVFPIQDSLGRVIGFGGRKISDDSATDKEGPKYLNSPETLLFNKSATLYALPQASAAIRQQNTAIVTEGYMDAIACHQAGVKNAVATLGTALTLQGARVLRRLCETVVLLFDGDEAGQRAADRAIQVLFAEPIDVRIATMSTAQQEAVEAGLPKPKDPDELLKQPGGKERFERMIASAGDALEFHFGLLRQRLAGVSLTARSRAVEEEIQRLGQLGLAQVSPVRYQLIIRRVASLAGVDDGTIRKVLEGQRRNVPAQTNQPAQPARPATPRHARDCLLAYLLVDGTLLSELDEQDRADLASTPSRDEAFAEVGRAVSAIIERGDELKLSNVLDGLEDEGSRSVAVGLAAFAEREMEAEPERLKQALRDCLDRLRRDRMTAAGEPDVQTRLDRLRDAANRFGGNPRALPRRSSAS